MCVFVVCVCATFLFSRSNLSLSLSFDFWITLCLDLYLSLDVSLSLASWLSVSSRVSASSTCFSAVLSLHFSFFMSLSLHPSPSLSRQLHVCMFICSRCLSSSKLLDALRLDSKVVSRTADSSGGRAHGGGAGAGLHQLVDKQKVCVLHKVTSLAPSQSPLRFSNN